MSKHYIRSVLSLSKAYMIRFFSDKTAMFFTFLFPLLFLFVFGSLNSGGSDISFRVALLNKSDSEFAQNFEQQATENETLDVNEDVGDLEEARDLMGRGELDSVLELPPEFGQIDESGVPSGSLVVYYSEASPQSGQTIAAVMEGVLDGINEELGHPEPPFDVEQRSTAVSGLSSFDYVFSGLLGFTILSLGIFGLANQMPAEKKTGAFRRLRAAPINSSHLIFANMVFYLSIGVLSLLMMLAAGILVFDFNMRGEWLDFSVMALLGIILMFGFGLAVGGWAKNDTQSSALSQVVALPMMFLSGVFFPRFLMPEWLQGITDWLPLTPIVDGLRLIMTEAKTVFDLGPEFAMIAIWTIVIYFVAVKVFRWE